MTQPFAIAIHGGAGTILREQMSDALRMDILATLEQAVRAGHQLLVEGADALDAVVAAVTVLEDSPLFNAGKGSVLTYNEMVEMDASVMHGAAREAGAIAGVRHIRNPVQLARDVLRHSDHVFLIGDGAEQFAFQQGHVYTEQDYFFTERRYEQLQNMKQQDRFALSEASYQSESAEQEPPSEYPDDKKFGTVGAVALDQQAIWRRRPVRVGSPINALVAWATRQSSALER